MSKKTGPSLISLKNYRKAFTDIIKGLQKNFLARIQPIAPTKKMKVTALDLSHRSSL